MAFSVKENSLSQNDSGSLSWTLRSSSRYFSKNAPRDFFLLRQSRHLSDGRAHLFLFLTQGWLDLRCLNLRLAQRERGLLSTGPTFSFPSAERSAVPSSQNSLIFIIRGWRSFFRFSRIFNRLSFFPGSFCSFLTGSFFDFFFIFFCSVF